MNCVIIPVMAMNGWTSKAILILQQEAINYCVLMACLNQCPACCWGPEVSLPTSLYSHFRRPPLWHLRAQEGEGHISSTSLGSTSPLKPGVFIHYRCKKEKSVLMFSVDCGSQIEWGNTRKIFCNSQITWIVKACCTLKKNLSLQGKYWKIIPLHTCLWWFHF